MKEENIFEGWRPNHRRHSPTPLDLGHLSHIFTCTDPKANEVPPASPTPPAAPAKTDDDVITHILGDFGPWQLRSLLILFLCKIPAAWFMACILFTAPDLYPEEEYTCDTIAFGPVTNLTVSLDQCYVMVNYGDAGYAMRQCRKFLYTTGFHSLTMEFDLVCLCDFFVAWSQYWHLFGLLIGGVAATKLMRVLSPRQIYGSGIWCLLMCSLLMGMVKDFSLHCGLRCLAAVSCCFMITSGHYIFSDITAGKYRLGALLLYDSFWALGLILLPGLAYGAPSWQHIYVGVTLSLLVIVFLLPWTPDSPRWQLQHTKESQLAIERTVGILLEAARINGSIHRVSKELPHQLGQLRDRMQEQELAVHWMQLWMGQRRSSFHLIAVHLALATFMVVNTGLLLHVRSFGRQHLVSNTLAMGLAEMLGCFLALHLTFNQSARKWQWAGGFAIVVGCIGSICWFLAEEDMPEVYGLTLGLLMASLPQAAVACAQSMILACLGELVPAEQRGCLSFSAVTWARVWQLSASFLTLLRQVSPALSLSAFCLLVILGGICTCFLSTPKGEEKPEGATVHKKQHLIAYT
ncbi:LOW QUALITY PROTEIN: solute carrier family 22 member 13 [Drosophila rhopaloa]|uniref:Solute carrier family 22 member 3 n=1 Tax=Drosophila rhopaloa TaxID=1041015 RepID=A0ABM5I6C8_DRORH|nr:LOW QUALITY PROTEIN: solute carrier family 22 member 13 [Drosophila rhopaloa]